MRNPIPPNPPLLRLRCLIAGIKYIKLCCCLTTAFWKLVLSVIQNIVQGRNRGSLCLWGVNMAFMHQPWERVRTVWNSSFVSYCKTHATCFQNKIKFRRVHTLTTPHTLSTESMVWEKVFCGNRQCIHGPNSRASRNKSIQIVTFERWSQVQKLQRMTPGTSAILPLPEWKWW